MEQITKIEFSIFGNNDVKKASVIKEEAGITLAESYDYYEPKRNGLMDLRMGVTDSFLECDTCGYGPVNCPGHCGHIELAEAVFHFGFFSKQLKDVLSCICLRCSKLLVHKNEQEI